MSYHSLQGKLKIILDPKTRNTNWAKEITDLRIRSRKGRKEDKGID